MAETGEREVSEMAHPNYEAALQKRGAVLHEDGAWVPVGINTLAVDPRSGSGWDMGGRVAVGRSPEEVERILAGVGTSAAPTKMYRVAKSDRRDLIIFFSHLREEAREGLVSAARWVRLNVRPARAFWQGQTLVVEYSDQLGLVIGRGGKNIRPLQDAMARNGLGLVVRLTAEAASEKYRKDAEFEAACEEGRLRAEAEAPVVAAREAAAAKEVKRQALLGKKELLERKLKEQEGTQYEERILELLLQCEEEIAAFEKGGE